MRERLADHFQETHLFTAQFAQYGKTDDGENVACFRNVHIDHRWVADHVWVHRSQQMYKQNLQPGDTVQFEARVGRYPRHTPRPHFEATEWDYNLEKIREFRVIWRRKHEGNEGTTDGTISGYRIDGR